MINRCTLLYTRGWWWRGRATTHTLVITHTLKRDWPAAGAFESLCSLSSLARANSRRRADAPRCSAAFSPSLSLSGGLREGGRAAGGSPAASRFWRVLASMREVGKAKGSWEGFCHSVLSREEDGCTCTWRENFELGVLLELGCMKGRKDAEGRGSRVRAIR